jgi:hypothetical protein
MGDEYQSTLKGKISILYQLEKWVDVAKLCDLYTEKYGKEIEIDMMRYKSMRHLGMPIQGGHAAAAKKDGAQGTALPSVPAAKESVLENTDLFAPPQTALEEIPVLKEKQMDYDAETDDNELVITDPFADDEPGLSLAPDAPPVELDEMDNVGYVGFGDRAMPEMAAPVEVENDSVTEEVELDFKGMGTMAIETDPQLTRETPMAHEPKTMAGRNVLEDDRGHSTSGGYEDHADLESEWRPPTAESEAEDEVRNPLFDRKNIPVIQPAARKKTFNLKLALWVVLPLFAIVVLWLALSGKLSSSGAEAQAPEAGPTVSSPAIPHPRSTRKIVPAAVPPKVDEQEKAFNDKFIQAGDFFNEGKLAEAMALVLEAKKIKMTEPLRLLEEQLTKRIRAEEEQASLRAGVVQDPLEQETKAFSAADTENSVAAWQNFMKAYPNSDKIFRAEKKIVLLLKKEKDNAEQQLILKIQQGQKVTRRSGSLNLSQVEIDAVLRQNSKLPTQFETLEHGGEKVMLDYASGLMWKLWDKPMAYDKAKWWANRICAGFGGWRLPTTEEAISLLRMERGQFSGLADVAVWTGDMVTDQARMIWVLKLPEGQFLPAAYDQAFYVWAVRQAGK